eukprot:7364822-Prorocentrum_lima.AAC.1
MSSKWLAHVSEKMQSSARARQEEALLHECCEALGQSVESRWSLKEIIDGKRKEPKAEEKQLNR